MAVPVHDLARLQRAGAQPRDDVVVAAVRHEADVLAVRLRRHRQGEPRGFPPHPVLGHAAQRKTQEIELLAGRREQEIALVLAGVGGPMQLRARQALHIVAGGERGRVEVPRRRQQVAELHRPVALHAGQGRFAGEIAVGEVFHDGGPEAALIVQHVMRNADPVGDRAGVVDVLAGAAGALALRGRTVVVKLQGDADDLMARLRKQRRRDGTVHAAGHGDDHAGGCREDRARETLSLER